MDHTPLKTISLRSTPRKIADSNDTLKKVRFSKAENLLKDSTKGKENKIYKAEDVLSMMDDSSLSEDETSTDEEWIITKSKALKIADSPDLKKRNNTLIKNTGIPLKEAVVIISPLKLLCRSECEASKIKSMQKNEPLVSPIVLKRKTDNKHIADNTLSVLTPSSKLNTPDLDSKNISNSSRRSLRRKQISYEEAEEDECTPAKRITPEKKRKVLPKRSIRNPKTYLEDAYSSESSDYDKKSFIDRIQHCDKNIDEKYASSPESPKIVYVPRTPRTSARKKLVLNSPLISEAEIPVSTLPKPLHATRSSVRKKLGISSPVVTDIISSNLRRTPRRSVRKILELSPSKSNKKFSCDTFSEEESEEFQTPSNEKILRSCAVDTPNLRRQVLTPKRSAKKTLSFPSPGNKKKIGTGFLSPIVQERLKSNLGTPATQLDITRAKLHTSNIPKSLPCREKEFNDILNFTTRKIEDNVGGCMYISGVPGTGKTATVHAVVKLLQEKVANGDLSKFDFVEVNGLRLTEPRQAYSRIWLELSKNKCSPDMALSELEKKFNKKCKHSTLILVDELDYLCNRRQDVIYNILEWSTKCSAALIVITIANTMDLPERTLKGKVTSRMGLTRLVFQPYKFQQLEHIVLNRIGTNSNFHVDAVQLVARKVAAVSGDARRALDICRRATELISSDADVVKVSHIEKALAQIFAGTRVQAIKKCSVMSQFLLRAMRDEFHRTGVEETTVGQVYSQFSAIVSLEGYEVPPIGILLTMATVLSDSGLILAEKNRSDLFRKISLNVSPDDIHYALSC